MKMNRAQAEAFRRKIELAAAWTDDADALGLVELFPAWQAGRAYISGERIRHEGLLYKCAQAHTPQENWTPDKTPALWVRVFVEEYPEWVQPQGAADAYSSGDKVSHGGAHWVSCADANVWEPGVYGWEAV